MDPITMYLIAQAAIGVGKAGYGAYQKRRGKRQLDSAFEAPTGTPSEYADLIDQARSSDIANRRIEEINRTMATSTDALQQAGSRAVLGGIGSVTQAGATSKTNALAQQQADIMRALERGTVGAEFQRRRDVARQNLEEGRAIGAIEAGAKNIEGGLMDVTQAGLGYGQARSEGLISAPKSNVAAKKMAKIDKQAAKLDAIQGTLEDPEYFGDMEEFPVIQAKHGAKVKKTPGSFSHRSNPIDIIQEGAKIGEMTGGEYIFNPKQAKKMQQLSKTGSSDLHKFVRSLLNKPQFK